MELSRRDFNRLSMAALGGVVAGATVGCGGSEPAAPPAANQPQGSTPSVAAVAAAEIHGCRGMNSCKGLGAGKDNACAGQGACATTAHHDCAGKNECKGLGGCGGTAGKNDCKAMGGCHVPMHAGAWEDARKVFEEKMTATGKKFGDAPPRKAG